MTPGLANDPRKLGALMFDLLVENPQLGLGDVEPDEMDRVFNMGLGLVLVVSPYYAESIRHQLKRSGIETWTIGRVVEGEQGVVWA